MLAKYIEKFKGEAIAVISIRYVYRGILTEIEDDYLVLSNPFAVETTGRSTATQPTTEDAIPCDIAIPLGAIELIFQPTWGFFGYGK